MPSFEVRVTIENKPGISDPEGKTILDDLVLRGTQRAVSEVRTAKLLVFRIEAADGEEAKSAVQEICDDLRIYNPLVSRRLVILFGVNVLHGGIDEELAAQKLGQVGLGYHACQSAVL